MFTILFKSRNLLNIRKYELESCGQQAFFVAAPMLWNTLQVKISQTKSLNSFKSLLKIPYFLTSLYFCMNLLVQYCRFRYFIFVSWFPFLPCTMYDLPIFLGANFIIIKICQIANHQWSHGPIDWFFAFLTVSRNFWKTWSFWFRVDKFASRHITLVEVKIISELSYILKDGVMINGKSIKPVLQVDWGYRKFLEGQLSLLHSGI